MHTSQALSIAAANANKKSNNNSVKPAFEDLGQIRKRTY